MEQLKKEVYQKAKALIEIAVRNMKVQWTLSTGKIYFVAEPRINLFTGNSVPTCYTNDNLLIRDLIPPDLYRLIWYRTARFFCVDKTSRQKEYLLSCSIDRSFLSIQDTTGQLAYVFLSPSKDKGQLTVTPTDAIRNLNCQILLIHEIIQEVRGRLIYTSSMRSGSSLSLMRREYDVLHLLSEGYNSERMAKLLCISRHTVDDCRRKLLDKFEVQNIFELIYHAHEEGFL
jgi:DNA-binding CsgD family transcriptional regulator